MNYTDHIYSLPEGDYAEVGVWKGDGAERIAKWMNPEATLWLFDSFTGHAEPCHHDNAAAHPKGRYADTSPEEVQARAPKAIILKGYVPETFRIFLDSPRKFRFVRIDVDHYLPTKAACEFFKARMVSSGVIEFDDYACSDCPGATAAIDEVFGKENISQSAPYYWTAI